jgi:Transposase DDE domain
MKTVQLFPNSIHTSRKNFDLVKTFCFVDDFFSCISISNGKGGRPSVLSVSEMVTICLLGQVYEIPCMKRLYELVKDCFTCDFKLPNYQNFVRGMNDMSRYLLLFINSLLSLRNTTDGDVCFVDGTKIEVCKIYREKRHKTMKVLATKSKSTTGWWYGLKLHTICDRNGNFMKLRITTATVGEREILSSFMDELHDSIIVGDAGYVSSELDTKANQNNNILLTAKRKNMKTIAETWQNKAMSMRSRIETVFDLLKERYNLVTSLPRSVSGYLAHYVRCLFGYMVLR